MLLVSRDRDDNLGIVRWMGSGFWMATDWGRCIIIYDA